MPTHLSTVCFGDIIEVPQQYISCGRDLRLCVITRIEYIVDGLLRSDGVNL